MENCKNIFVALKKSKKKKKKMKKEQHHMKHNFRGVSSAVGKGRASRSFSFFKRKVLQKLLNGEKFPNQPRRVATLCASSVTHTQDIVSLFVA